MSSAAEPDAPPDAVLNGTPLPGAPGADAAAPMPVPARGGRCWRWLRATARWTEHVLAVIGVVLIVYVTCFRVEVMETSSMAPTLIGRDHGPPDYVLVERISYWFRTPRRWELVAHRDSYGTPVIKRAIAFKGETVRFMEGVVEVDGTALVPPANFQYFAPRADGSLFMGRTYECRFGTFVLGDDSRDSFDSRYTGPIPETSVVGRGLCIIWPPSRWTCLLPAGE